MLRGRKRKVFVETPEFWGNYAHACAYDSETTLKNTSLFKPGDEVNHNTCSMCMSACAREQGLG